MNWILLRIMRTGSLLGQTRRPEPEYEQQGRRLVLSLLQAQPHMWTNGRWRRPRLVLQVFVILCCLCWLGLSIPPLLAFLALVGTGSTVAVPSISASIGIFPIVLYLLGALAFVPLRSMAEAAERLLQTASEDTGQLSPNVNEQVSLTPGVFGDNHQEITALMSWSERNYSRVRAWPEISLILLGLAFGALAILQPYEAVTAMLAPFALATFGLGVLAFFGFWRISRLRRFGLSNLVVVVDADGIAWRERLWRRDRQRYLAWRDIQSFSVIDYRDSSVAPFQHIYVLAGDQAELLWIVPAHPTVEQSSAHNYLVRAVQAKTQLPLRNLADDATVLGAQLRSAYSWTQSYEEKLFAASQPAVPGVPLQQLRTWGHRFIRIVVICSVVTVVLEAVTLVAATH